MKWVWTCAALDPSGGAGISVDNRVFSSLGVQGCSILSATTAQSSEGVLGFFPIEDSVFQSQGHALGKTHPPSAIKSGVLCSEKQWEQVREWKLKYQVPWICDPVLGPTLGNTFWSPTGIWKKCLSPMDLLTPNLPEASTLLGRPLRNEEEIEDAANEFLSLGVRNVLIKGGHGNGSWVSDYFCSDDRRYWIHLPRISSPSVRGTGCALSACIAAMVAKGHTLRESIVLGKALLHQAIAEGDNLAGVRYLNKFHWPVTRSHMPWIGNLTPSAFPSETPLGFYPLVHDTQQLKEVVAGGAKVVQLRIKELVGAPLERELRESDQFCKDQRVKLYINDHWSWAIRLESYGVHLGQEDLLTADIHRIHKSGLRLGISTHTFEELAIAKAYRPSYIALGPVFETQAKKMPYPPQTLDRVRIWSSLVDVPLVAIGGLTPERAKSVLENGTKGLAVMTDLLHQPRSRSQLWSQVCRS